MKQYQNTNASKQNSNINPAATLTAADQKFLKTKEETVSRGQTDAALALHAIHTHEKKPWIILGFKTFAEYAAARFGYKKNHTHRMCRFGEFLQKVMKNNASTGEKLPLPPTEGFFREIHRLGNYIDMTYVIKELATAGKPLLASEAKVLVEALLAQRPVQTGKARKAPPTPPQLQQHCQRLMEKLREKVSELPQNKKINDLLAKLEKLLAEQV